MEAAIYTGTVHCTVNTFKNAIKNIKHILDLLIKNFNVHILNKIFHLKPVEPEIYESRYHNPSFVNGLRKLCRQKFLGLNYYFIDFF